MWVSHSVTVLPTWHMWLPSIHDGAALMMLADPEWPAVPPGHPTPLDRRGETGALIRCILRLRAAHANAAHQQHPLGHPVHRTDYVPYGWQQTDKQAPTQTMHPTQVMEHMVMSAMQLWSIPDMDFIMHFGDSCPYDGAPVLSRLAVIYTRKCVCRWSGSPERMLADHQSSSSSSLHWLMMRTTLNVCACTCDAFG
jgi:hypothetical protein